MSNPIRTALTQWVSSIPKEQLGLVDLPSLILQSPKRWVAYEPLIILPSGSFSSSAWSTLLSSVTEADLHALWISILSHVSRSSKSHLTHLAINEGIPRHESDCASEQQKENVLRSPVGLHMLYGDFGPVALLAEEANAGNAPSPADFASAFWVSTKQNGVRQTWAPRWTMFSRGNVKEKNRILNYHAGDTHHGRTEPMARETGILEARTQVSFNDLESSWAVDLYAGIGYFVFSYAKLGMRVLCWELNPWSVEGLRRGAIANGWSVRIIQGQELITLSMQEILGGQERIVVFLEDNARAYERLQQLGPSAKEKGVRHVNCGFLPTSQLVWEDAWKITRDLGSGRSWLHLHENVGAADIETRKQEIQNLIDKMPGAGDPLIGMVEHVELVKTFAPGVWHCVFDVFITGSENVS